MRRAGRLCLAALASAALALLLTPVTAAATSEARLAAAALIAAQAGHHGLHGPAPDRAMVLGAWRDAGVDIRDLATPADLLHACQILDVRAPRPAGPAPGDYALYRDVDGTDRIAMFLSPAEVAVVDAGGVRVVPRAELSDDTGDVTVERLLSQPSSFHACRLPAARWPQGHDDTSVGVGRIALADPELIAQQMAWAAQHPRDADTSVGHTLERIAGAIAAGLAGTLEQLVSGLFTLAHAFFAWLPAPVGAPFLWLGDVLGRGFDGRALHRVLTALTAAALGLLLAWSGPVGWVVLGALLGGAAASAAGVPVLGALGGALVGGGLAVASFLAGTLTGIDGSARVTVGTVLFALVADMLWVRPLLLSLGFAAHLERVSVLPRLLARVEQLRVLRFLGGDGRSALDVSSTFGDALSLRPHAMAHIAQHLRNFGAVTAGDSAHVAARTLSAAPVHTAMSSADALAAMGRRSADMLSLAWRPSSISSDLLGHVADAVHFLEGEVRAGFPSMPRVAHALDTLAPEQRQAVCAAADHAATHLVPQLQITARLSHLHSGARSLTGLATGHPNNTATWWRWWRSPVRRRLLHGLPGSGAGPAT